MSGCCGSYPPRLADSAFFAPFDNPNAAAQHAIVQRSKYRQGPAEPITIAPAVCAECKLLACACDRSKRVVRMLVDGKGRPKYLMAAT